MGKGLYNSVAVIEGGRVISIHRKSLLPTYDVFDERWYFDPAETVEPAVIQGRKFGITICEDVWNDPDFWTQHLNDFHPASSLFGKAQKRWSASPLHPSP